MCQEKPFPFRGYPTQAWPPSTASASASRAHLGVPPWSPSLLTCVTAFMHHEHVGSNADHATDITFELAIGQPDATRGVRLWPTSITVAQGLRQRVFHDHTIVLFQEPLIWPQQSTRLLIAVHLHLDGVGWRVGGCLGQRQAKGRAFPKARMALPSPKESLSPEAFSLQRRPIP